MDYGFLFVSKGRVGTNDEPRCSEVQVSVHFDGQVSVYEMPDSLEAFKTWAEVQWGLDEDEQGEWCGNRLHLD